jgi:hypothetical protein
MTKYSFDDFIPGINYSSTNGRWSIRERDELTGETCSTHIEQLRALIDIGTFRWGAVSFDPFDLRTVPISEVRPLLPDVKGADGKPAFKQVVEALLYSPAFGLRRLLASSNFVSRALLEFVSDAENFPEAQKGQVPVVDWVGNKPMRVPKGPASGKVFYAPDLSIIGWMDRLDIFGERTVPIPKPQPALIPQVMMTQSGAVALPAAKPETRYDDDPETSREAIGEDYIPILDDPIPDISGAQRAGKGKQ